MYQILAAAAEAEASHGVHPAVIGIGAFIILMVMLGVTFLFSGIHQEPSAEAKTVAEVERAHKENRRR